MSNVRKGANVQFRSTIFVLTTGLLLSACGQTDVTCGDVTSKSALETAIRESLEKTAIERAKPETGTAIISNSAIRASIAKIKLVIENVRTTKEDPDSTKRFCTGSLKIVFSPETFADANRARELAGLTSVEELTDSVDVEKGADYLKSDLDYNVQPTDDGEKVFAEFEDAAGKLSVFGEIVAASLLKGVVEKQVRQQEEQEKQSQQEQEAALSAVRSANVEQANLVRQSAEQALAVAWKSLEPGMRQRLLPQQRAWIKQKEASCKMRAIQGATDPLEQRTLQFQCEGEMANSRASELQRFIGYSNSPELGEVPAMR